MRIWRGDRFGSSVVADRLEALHRVLHPGRDHSQQASGPGARRPRTSAEWATPPSCQCVGEPQHRCLSRVHRHDCTGDSETARRAAAGGTEYTPCCTGAIRGGWLGFNNSYALAVRSRMHGKGPRSRLGPRGIRATPRGIAEFLGRADGWPTWERAYNLRFPPPKGLDHGLAYKAIAGGQVDVIDIYTTDAEARQVSVDRP